MSQFSPLSPEAASGDMAQLVEATDWAQSPLGPRALWPQSLQTLVKMLLAHPLPMILLWGSELIQIYNDGYRPLLGRRHPDALGMPTKDCWPEVWHFNAPIYRRVTQNGESVLLEDALFQLVRNGPIEDLYFNVAYGPARDEDDNISGVFVTVTETTQKYLAEADRSRLLLALSNERSRLATVIEQAPAFICILRGPEHVFELANEQYYDFVGRRDIIGKSVRIALPEVEGQQFFAILDEVYRTGEPYRGLEMPLLLCRKCNGVVEQLFVNFIYQVMRESDGTISGIFTHGVDVTELVVARETARIALVEADMANKAKDKFLAMLSHELRTPLTPVAMIAAAMEMDPSLPDHFKDDLTMIRRNVELETRLIDDLLDVNRIRSGKLRLDVRVVDVHALIVHAVRIVGPDLHEKNLTIVKDLHASNDRVKGDAARLQQALWNLLKNAVKFTPENGRISISTRNGQDRLFINVEDSGRGIAPERLHDVFDPFDQGGPDTTREHGGIGLSLAIAKAVAECHGGSLSVASQGVSQGATFSLSLPLATADEPASVTPIGSVDSSKAIRLRLLLVEDHPDTGRAMTRLLKHAGNDVRWASSVTAAMALLENETFDLLLSDIGLPDGTGHDLMREVLLRYAMPGIAMSGYSMEEDIRKSRKAGFTEHLVKPVTLPQLQEAIGRVVGRATTMQLRSTPVENPGSPDRVARF